MRHDWFCQQILLCWTVNTQNSFLLIMLSYISYMFTYSSHWLYLKRKILDTELNKYYKHMTLWTLLQSSLCLHADTMPVDCPYYFSLIDFQRKVLLVNSCKAEQRSNRERERERERERQRERERAIHDFTLLLAPCYKDTWQVVISHAIYL